MQKVCSLVLVGLLMPLTGCTSLFGTGDYGQYSAALQAHSTAESERIQAQSNAISEAATVGNATSTERILLSVIAMMQIERLQPLPLGIVKPTTGMDVLAGAVEVVPFVAGMGGMYLLGKEGIRAAGNVSIGSDSTVSGSFNKPTATSLDGNATAAPGVEVVEQPAPIIVEQQVVQPTIVEPTVIQAVQ